MWTLVFSKKDGEDDLILDVKISWFFRLFQIGDGVEDLGMIMGTRSNLNQEKYRFLIRGMIWE